MDSNEFSEIRKKLNKTQKELAALLGTSLKAVCSYEQGWRTIPTHVERQIIFLLSRKTGSQEEVQDCWTILSCPDERRLQCPAWEFKSGKLCWFINGTICDCKSQENWKEKLKICRQCKVLKTIL